MTDPRFVVRSCPLCGGDRRQLVINLEAAEFCTVNWSYDPAWRGILGLSQPASFPVDRCLDCRFVYARLLPDAEFLRRLYDQVMVPSFREGSENAASYARRMRYVATLLESSGTLEAPWVAFDFGCGTGATIRVLAAAGVRAIGLDASAMRVQDLVGQGHRVVSSLTEVPVSDRFGILVADNTLEHVPDVALTLRSLAERCIEGAVAFVSVPSYEDAFLEQQARRARLGLALDMTLNPWEHLNYFNLHHMREFMRAAGFVPLRAAALAAPVEVGLRPEASAIRRLKNALRTAVRLGRYALTGRGVESTVGEFYRFAPPR